MDSPDYISAQTKKILSIREKYPFQPIIFAGSGLSRRWVKAPTWVELLEWAIGNCPDVDRPLHFFRQQEPELPKIATRISEIYQSWAWGSGQISIS